MAIASKQQRMAAVNHTSPWRGVLVDATVDSFTAENRAAAVFAYYSGATLNAARNGIIHAAPTYLGSIVTNPTYTGAIVAAPG